jgi:hypothetical protein
VRALAAAPVGLECTLTFHSGPPECKRTS